MENGKCALVEKLTNNVGFGSTEFHVFRCGESLSNRYLFALLNTDNIRYLASCNMKGSSGHRRVPDTFYSSMEIPVPPMDIQKKIADECGAIDKEFKEKVDKLFRLRQELSDYIDSLQMEVQ